MFTWLLLAPCVVLLSVYISFWIHGRRARRMLAALPSYPGLPLIGNAHQVLGDGDWTMKFLEKVSRLLEEKGLPYRFWLGPYPIIIVSDPEDVRVVTNASIEKPHFYNLSKDFVGDGLISAPGSIWKQNIKKLGNIFNPTIVEGYQDTFNRLVEKMVDKLRGEAGWRSFEVVEDHLTMTTLHTICQTALGIPSDMLDTLISPAYYQTYMRAERLLMNRVVTFPYHLDFIYHLTPSYREMMKCRDLLHGVVVKMIQMKRKEREGMRKNGKLNTPESNKMRAFIEILLDMQEADPTMSDEYIKAEVFTMIGAGHGTVNMTALFALLMLGNHPEVQQKLNAEMKEIFGNSKRSMEKKDMTRMPYCEAVVKETLRLYPAIPFFMRAADKDFELKSCTVPKGTGCGVAIWGANRLKSSWGEDAEEFRPERWIENDYPEHSPSFIPFSYGRRPCIGKRYAIPLLKTILAYCIRDLEFESIIEKMTLEIDITIKPKNCYLKVQERKNL